MRLLQRLRDQLETRRLFNLMQEAGHVGVFDYRFDTDRLTWSPGQCKMFGVAALPAGGLERWYARIAANDRDRVERELWSACALRRGQETLDYCAVLPDGRHRWLSSRAMLRYGADGRAMRMMGVTVDGAQQRAKDDLLAMLGHELRNPIGAISAASDVLEAVEPDAPAAVEARAIIARQAHALVRVVNDLVAAGRAVAGKPVATPALTQQDMLRPSRRRNVLVVDGDDDVLAALRAELELGGHRVSTAADGIEGLTRLLELKPEVSIIDIGLSGLTGLELARHARASGYAGRMIALSGYEAGRDEHEARVAGFDAYLVKPVAGGPLRACLDEA